jgi:hypothetical protein
MKAGEFVKYDGGNKLGQIVTSGPLQLKVRPKFDLVKNRRMRVDAKEVHIERRSAELITEEEYLDHTSRTKGKGKKRKTATKEEIDHLFGKDAENAETPKITASEVRQQSPKLKPDFTRYERKEIRLTDGTTKRVLDIGDGVAMDLSPLSLDEAYDFVLDELVKRDIEWLGKGKKKWHRDELDTRWTHLNKGMQRMNLGNVLRAVRNRGIQ